MNEIRRYILNNWAFAYSKVNSDAIFIEFLGPKNRSFLLEIGMPEKLGDYMESLIFGVSSISPSEMKVIEKPWNYLAIFGRFLEYGSPLGSDEIYRYSESHLSEPVFVNSSLENFFYCVIKFNDILTTVTDYSFENFEADYNIIEPNHKLFSQDDFWSQLMLWQMGDEDIF